MTAIDHSRSLTPVFVGRAVASIYGALASVANWNDARVTRNSLSRLSARELDDIGLNYGDIDAVATRIRR